MKTILKKYSYDDVLLVPRKSSVTPKKADISSYLTEKIKLRCPIISSPMDTVTESKMAIKMAQLGAAGIIHKNMPYEDQVKEIKLVKAEAPLEGATLGLDGKLFVGISVSHSIKDEDIEKLIAAGADAFCLDSAHGHSANIINKAKHIKESYPQVELIAGNVATVEGARALAKAGVDAIRVGVGPGAICTTRVVTGIGVPQLSAVMDAVEGVKGTKTKIIADGGLKTSGDMAKALAAGAHTVMIGSMAAGTDEAPGDRIFINDKPFKMYRGMGSIGAMKRGSGDRYGQDGIKEAEKMVPEGVEGLIKYKGHIEDAIMQYIGGIKASFGYVGAPTIRDYWERAVFVEITAAGLNESHPHSLDSFETTANYGGR